MRYLLPLPVVLPLFAAGVSILAGRHRGAQRVIGLVTLAITTAASVAILIDADTNGAGVAFMGGWEAPVGIVLVGDRLAGLLLAVASPVLLAVLVYAIGQPGLDKSHPTFHPVYLVLASGVSLSLLTGDLFNLFVAFEMMLTASYILLTLNGRRDQVRSGMTYVVISLVASAFLILTVGLLYAATGTVTMADLAGRIGDLPEALRVTFGLMLFVTFGIKAAVFPLFFWLPDSYPTAPTPVTAVFAGLLTKVGVYCIIRTQTLLVAPDDRASGVILAVAGITMVVGVLGAIAQGEIKRILSFHIVSQIGYMILGLGLFTVAGVAAAILYVVNQMVLKCTLLLTGGLVEHAAGSSRLSEIGGIARRYPLLGWLFLLPALSLAGIPPLSGFVAKLGIVQAGLAAEEWLVVGAALVVSLLTLFSMTKIWGGAYWGEPEVVADPADPVSLRHGGTWPMLGATATLVVGSLALAVFAGPLYEICVRAAEDLLLPTDYIRAVMG